MDGFQDEDGCPDLDNDRDGIADSDDKCPDVAETVDGWKDEDGCPDPDNDGDTFLDVDDLCPDRAEDGQGDRPDDGCPSDVQVARKGETIHLLKKVKFSKKSRLSRSSKEVLLALAQFLTENPDILQVRVEGHTSSRGKEKTNLKTSSKEAKAVVKRLIKYGVDATRLEAVGYGESRPIRSNRTRSGRAQNRRIEVTVLSDRMSGEASDGDEAGSMAPAAPAAPADAADPWGAGGPKPAPLPELKSGPSPWNDGKTDATKTDDNKTEESSEEEKPAESQPAPSPWGG